MCTALAGEIGLGADCDRKCQIRHESLVFTWQRAGHQTIGSKFPLAPLTMPSTSDVTQPP